jgi:hypothetical protein
MAHADTIDSAAIQSLALQVGQRLADFRPPSSLVTLHESLRLWLLPPGDATLFQAQTRDVDLAEIAQPSDRWHHQLHDGGEPFGFARSTQKDHRWELHEIFDTPIAASIHTAILTVEEQPSLGDPLVRLVYAPAFQTYTLWLVDAGRANSRVVVAYAPSQFAVTRNLVVESPVLLRELSLLSPIVGLSPG